jgi:hypothetical protein
VKNKFMQKLVLFMTMFLGFQLEIISQTISLGPELKDIRNGFLSEIIGKDEDGVFVERVATKKKVIIAGFKTPLIYTLESYNMEMQKTNGVPQAENEKENKVITEYFNTILFKNKLYVLKNITDLNTKMNSLVIEEIDKTSLYPEGISKTLTEFSFEEGSKKNTGDFSVNMSNDSSKLLVYCRYPYEKGSSKKFGLHVFDTELNEIWQNDITLPYNEELFELRDFSIGND